MKRLMSVDVVIAVSAVVLLAIGFATLDTKPAFSEQAWKESRDRFSTGPSIDEFILRYAPDQNLAEQFETTD